MKPNDHGLSVDERIALEAGELPRVRRSDEHPQVDIEDRANWVDYIAAVAANTQVYLLMEQPAATLYWAALGAKERAAGEDNQALQLMGEVMKLDALIASPEAVQAMLRCLRRELVECVPELALMEGNHGTH